LSKLYLNDLDKKGFGAHQTLALLLQELYGENSALPSPRSAPFWGSDFTSFDISTAWKGDGRVTAESSKTSF